MDPRSLYLKTAVNDSGGLFLANSRLPVVASTPGNAGADPTRRLKPSLANLPCFSSNYLYGGRNRLHVAA